MSGHYNYSNFVNKIPENIHIFEVPIIEATEESIKDYGRFVDNFANEKVINVKWPTQTNVNSEKGSIYYREIDTNTGDEALATYGVFTSYYDDKYCYSTNTSVKNGEYIIGVKPKTEKKNYFYTVEMNYHACGSQVVMNYNNEPFYLLLSKADDTIKPEDCRLFYFNGSKGFNIYPYIWHQPMYPLVEAYKNVVSQNKQCSVHSCVTCNFIDEYKTILRINLDFIKSKL